VDTTLSSAWGRPWLGQSAAIYRYWTEFLASKAPRYTAPGAALSPYWDPAEQRRWITFPLALNISGGRGSTTILDVRPATPGTDSVFIVKTLFSTLDSQRLPLALIRVYAVRQGDRWVFSNALPRLTRAWRRVPVGGFTYVLAPGYIFHVAKARGATAFVDSVAKAFGIKAPSGVEYYLTESPDEMNRILGIDWVPSLTDGGAFSSGPNRLIVSGDPRQGEDYRHELAHIALSQWSVRGVHPFVWEGVATWLGGTLGMSGAETQRTYAGFLKAHPDVTLDGVMHATTDQGFRPAGAAFVRLIYARAGIAGVKALLEAGSSEQDLRAVAERTLGMKWTDVQSGWLSTAGH
jgi:hypothetical protein